MSGQGKLTRGQLLLSPFALWGAAAGARVVLEGEAVNPKRPAVVNPVAWMWKNEYGARSFYTSLGHPGDMGLEPVQRLLVNAMHELLGRKVKKWTGSLAIDVPYRGMVKTGA